MENIKINKILLTLEDIEKIANNSNRIVWGALTCWWKIGDPVYTLSNGLPCGPRGEVLFEYDNPIEFIQNARNNVEHYGKYGLKAFLLAYHGQIITKDDLPTSLDRWEDYNKLIQKWKLWM